MKKVLITGAAGFVGYHLIEHLKKLGGYEIYGTKLSFEKTEIEGVKFYDMDISSSEQVEKVVLDINPDYIYHLAAQSSVKRSWDDPVGTININVIGTVNLLEVVRKNNINCKILLIGSSEEYGRAFQENSSPSEDVRCIPENFYALTKNTQNQIGYLYSKAYGLNIVMTRSFNHIGIKQAPIFVVSDFCKQAVEIEKGLREPIIKVGNLDAYRDFTDVEDIVSAYVKLIDNGKSGETYNVGSGEAIKIKYILAKIIKMSSFDITVEVDENKYRKLDIEKAVANVEKIKEAINWDPIIELDDSIKNILEYYRKEITKEGEV